MKQLFSTILLSISIFISLAGQGVTRTPSAAVGSYEKYADIQPSLYTGAMSFPVQFGQVSEGPISLSVGMSYHSDLKAHQLSNEIGLGWSFSGLGAITREVRGLPDDSEFGFFATGGGLLSSSDDGDLVDDEELDISPDIYTFNVGGMSGKFTMDENRSVFQIYDSDIQIEYKQLTLSYESCEGDLGNGDEMCQTVIDETEYFFVITGTDGVKYYFGGSANKDNISVSGDSYAVAWHLFRVESYDALHKIDIIYTKSRYRYYSLTDCVTSLVLPICQETSFVSISAFTTVPYRIKTSTSEIFFEYERDRQDLYPQSTDVTIFRPKRLSKVHIKEGTFTKTFELKQTYFEDTGENEGLPDHIEGSIVSNLQPFTGKRLKLDQINLTSSTESIIPFYEFEYNNGDNFFPNQLTHAIDHWGYYNGKTDNNNEPFIIPEIITPIQFSSDVDRNTNVAGLRKGVLSKVTYATGGRMDFNYEANTYWRGSDNEITIPINQGTINGTCPPNFNNPTTSQSTHIISSADFIDGEIVLTLNGICTSTSLAELEIVDSKTNSVEETLSLVVTGIEDEDRLIIQNSNLIQGRSYIFRLSVYGGVGEVNILRPETGITRTVGGLRLSKTSTFDNNGNIIVRDYNYTQRNNTSRSSGKLYRSPKYVNQVVSNGPYYLSTNSLANIRSFEGFHCGYESVEIDYNGNGSRRVDFFADENILAQQEFLPVTPERARQFIGSESASSVYREDTAELSHSKTYLNDADNTNDLSINAFVYFGYEDHNIQKFKPYIINSGIYRPERIDVFNEGIKTTQEFTYNFSNQKEPVGIEVLDFDGDQISKNEIKYTSELASGAQRTYLSDRNMLIPWNTKSYINGSEVLESTQTYGLFNNNTHARLFILNEEHKDGPNTISNITNYNSYNDDGLLTSMRPPGSFVDHTFNYNDNHTISQKCIGTLCTSFTYFEDETGDANTSRLLKNLTAVDQTVTSYSYDDLIRLEKVTDCTNAKTTYDYNINQTRSHIKITQEFDDDTTNQSSLTLLETFQYQDGLGRVIQTVGKQQTYLGRDQIAAVEYDSQGRIKHEFEVFTSNGTNGGYSSPGINNPKTITTYEPSPLNRINSVTPPDWQGVPIAIQIYGTNTTEIHSYDGETFSIGSLFFRGAKDGNGNTNFAYSDIRGRTIYRAKTNQVDTTRTQFSYDYKNRVVKVIPPRNPSIVNNASLNFTYTYDPEDKILSKTIPSKGVINYRYDNRDLVIAYQDDHLRTRPSNKWYAYTFDNLGRNTASGFGTSTGTVNIKLEETIFYTSGTGKIGNINHRNSRMLNSSTWINSKTNYDVCGRIESIEKNNIISEGNASNDISTYTYDGASNVIRIEEKIRPGTNQTSDRTIIYNTHYDTDGRISKEFVDLDILNPQQTCELQYTNKDQVSFKLQGGDNLNWLQNHSYSYYENGNLNEVNEGTNTGFRDLFGCKLNYWQSDGVVDRTSQSIVPRYNGDINSSIWADDLIGKQFYNYRYDYLDRLTDNYTNEDLFNSNYTYDERGNLKTVIRNENGVPIDDLDYTYDSNNANRITSISDSGDPSLGYQKSNNNSIYEYDENGNLKTDPHKRISVTYNHLDLPETILWQDGRKLTFDYDGSGHLHRKSIFDSSNTLVQKHEYTGSFEYINDIIYKVMHGEGCITNEGYEDALYYLFLDHHQSIDGEFKAGIIESEGNIIRDSTDYEASEFVLLQKGFATKPTAEFHAHIGPNNNPIESWRYDYEIHDHLGNLRMVYTGTNRDNLEILQRQDYHPYGMSYQKELQTNLEGKYQFNGIHYAGENGLDWSMATYRSLDGALSIWGGVDPYAESFYSMSPYCAMGSNPINYTDPDGDVIGPWLVPMMKYALSKTAVATITASAVTATSAAAITAVATTTATAGTAISINSIPSGSSHIYNGGSFFDHKPLTPNGTGFVEQSFDINKENVIEYTNISAEPGKETWFQTHRGIWNSDQTAFYIRSTEFTTQNHYKFLSRMGGIDGVVSTSLTLSAGGLGTKFLTGTLATAGGILKNLWNGGKTFGQYKKAYWATRTKPPVTILRDPAGIGKPFPQYTELAHKYIPQRADWAPPWLKNNRINVRPMSSLKHAQTDPYRARFVPKWAKKKFNLKWK